MLYLVLPSHSHVMPCIPHNLAEDLPYEEQVQYLGDVEMQDVPVELICMALKTISHRYSTKVWKSAWCRGSGIPLLSLNMKKTGHHSGGTH